MDIEQFVEIKFNNQDKEWIGTVDGISPNNKVELSISVDNDKQNILEKIELIKKFSTDYDVIMSKLYDLTFQKHKNTKWEKSLDDIKQMYFLTAVALKNDNKTWWITLEPNFNVPTIYNHFLRFTMVNNNIVWMNLELH
jgi:hypothetical protein